MKTYFLKIVFAFSFFLLAFLPFSAFAGSEHNMSGWAWSSNIGWISFNSTNTGGAINYGVNKNDDGTLVGYAWSSVGWIKFGGLSGFPTGSGTQAQNANINGNNLKGWAKALSADGNGWDGWISFSGSGYGIKFDSGTGHFSQCNGTTSSCAWGSDVVGWLGFNDVILGESTGTCSDRVKNGDETGIDIGGRCDGTCSDGVKNGDETNTDYGGRCAIDGVWSDWGACVDGIETRTCTPPSRGGADCVGTSPETRACDCSNGRNNPPACNECISPNTFWTGASCVAPCPLGSSYDIFSSSCVPDVPDVPVVGACATTHYNCSAGESRASTNISTPSRWTWTCFGSNNTVSTDDKSCSQNKTPVFIED